MKKLVPIVWCYLLCTLPVLMAAEDFPQTLLNEKLETAVKNKAPLSDIEKLLDKGAESESAIAKAIDQDRADVLNKLLQAQSTALDKEAFNHWLGEAIKHGRWQALDTFLKHDTTQTVSGENVLSSVIYGKQAIFQRLLKRSKQPLQSIVAQHTDDCPLLKVVYGGFPNTEVLQQFLDAGSLPTGKCSDVLTAAPLEENAAAISLLLEAGAPVDEGSYQNPDSPVLTAIRYQHLDTLKVLLKAGMPLRRSTHPDKPLILAAETGATDTLAFLFEYVAEHDEAKPDFPALMAAASQHGHLDILKFLQQQGADLKTRVLRQSFKNQDADKPKSATTTLLHFAAENGHESLVSYLLEQGLAVDAGEYHDLTSKKPAVTALHLAAANGHFRVVETLLAHEAKPDLVDSDSGTPLSLAVKHNHSGIVRLLLKHEAKYWVWGMPEPPLNAAVRNDNRPMVKLLLGHQWPKQARYTISAKDQQGRTALHLAAEQADEDLVVMLSGYAASPDLPDDEGNTVLHYAAGQDSLSYAAFAYLLDTQKQINATNRQESTALALSIGHEDGFRAARLLENGANVHIKNTERQSLLHLLSQASPYLRHYAPGTLRSMTQQQLLKMMKADQGNIAHRVEWLLREGLKVDAKDIKGNTPLHYLAAKSNWGDAPDTLQNLFLQRFLLEKPVLDIRNEQGETALFRAVNNHQNTNANLLLAAGADPDLTNTEGNAPLFLAVMQNNAELVDKLISYGADVNLEDADGQNPLFALVDSGLSKAVLDRLLEAGIELKLKDKEGNNIIRALAGSSSKEEALPTLRAMLERGVDPNVRNASLETALHRSVLANAPKTTELLLQYKANPDLRDHNGATPLHYAVRTHAFYQLELLLDKGADPNLMNYFGKTPLHLAVEQQDQAMAEILLAAGAEPDTLDKDLRTPLIMAAALKDTRLALWLIDKGAGIHQAAKGGWQAMHFAAVNGDAELLAALLQRGADPLAKTWRGDDVGALERNSKEKPLPSPPKPRLKSETREIKGGSLASDINATDAKSYVMAPSIKTCTLSDSGSTECPPLIRGGVGRGLILPNLNPNQSSLYAQYPLEDAVLSAYYAPKEALQHIQTLLDQGADINQKNRHGETPLFLAVRENLPPEVSALLLKSGADPNIPDFLGISPLIQASEHAKLSQVQQLLAAGADLQHRYYAGENALQRVLIGKPQRTARRLAEPGQEWASLTAQQRAELLNQARQQHQQVALLLLEKGIQPDAPGRGIYSQPLQLALLHAYQEVLRSLVSRLPDTDLNIMLQVLENSLWVGVPEVSEILLEAVAGHDFNNDKGWQLLHVACQQGDEYAPVVKHLLAQGAAKQLDTDDKRLPLLVAATKEDAVESLKHLQAQGVSLQAALKGHVPVDNLLQLAAQASAGKVMAYLLESGFSVDKAGDNKSTALMLAGMAVDAAAVELLLEHGADPRRTDKEGNTVLDYLQLTSKHTPEQTIALAELLLEKGADFKQARNPLGAAIRDNNLPLLRFYQERFAVDLAKPVAGKHYLYRALSAMPDKVNDSQAYLQRLDLVAYLLEQGADINAPTRIKPDSWPERMRDITPVEQALAYPEFLELLIKQGADLTVSDNNDSGSKAGLLQQLLQKDSTPAIAESLRLLVAAGAPLNQLDKQGNGAIHALLEDTAYDSADTLELASTNLQYLLEQGIDVTQLNQQGQTVLDAALSDSAVADSLILQLIPHFIEFRDHEKQQVPAPLIAACERRGKQRGELLNALLNQGAAVNSVNAGGETCLHKVLANGYRPFDESERQFINQLLDAGADLDHQDKHGVTPLLAFQQAAMRSHETPDLKVLEALLKRRPNLNLAREEGGQTALHLITDPDVLKMYLKYDVDIHAVNKAGESLLHRTAKPEVARLLLEKGAKPEQRDAMGATPLSHAVRDNNRALIEVYLLAGARFDGTDSKGNSLLHYYSRIRSFSGKNAIPAKQLLGLLIAKGAPANQANNDGDFPLHQLRNREAIALLLANGADINARNLKGETLLHHVASERDNTGLAEWLIGRGADIQRLDHDGETPLFKAAYLNQRSLAQLLLANGADATLKNKTGDTPLHIALAKNHLQIAETLIAALSDEQLKVLNWEQKTPLHFAFDHKQFGMATLLAARGVTEPAWPNAVKGQAGNPFWLQRSLKTGLPDVAAQLLVPKAHVSEDEIRRRVMLREFGTNRTNLQLATLLGADQLFEPLLKFGAQTDARNSKSETALLMAIRNGQQQSAIRLLELGAAADIIDEAGNTLLHHAVLGWQAELLQLAFETQMGLDVNAQNEAGNTPLMLAVETGNREAVEILLQHKADVNLANRWSLTPLLMAAQKVDEVSLDILLASGADITARDDEGRNALLRMIHQYIHAKEVAASPETTQRLLRMAGKLLKAGIKLEFAGEDGRTALHLGAVKREIADFLLEQGADVHALDGEKNTPLFHAVRADFVGEGQLEVCERLLAEGSDITHRNQWGETLLQKAVRAENFPVIELLIERGVDINVANEGGYTPLHNIVHSPVFSKENKRALIKALLSRKVDLNKADGRGYTPLHVAILDELDGIAGLLVEKGADLNRSNSQGNTALHLLAKRRHHGNVAESGIQLFQQLIEAGADINLRNAAGKTALLLVIERANKPLTELLLTAGAKMDSRDMSGDTALHMAANGGQARLLKLLLDKGVDLNVKNNVGNTALHIVCGKEDQAGIDLLLAAGADRDVVNFERRTPGMLSERCAEE